MSSVCPVQKQMPGLELDFSSCPGVGAVRAGCPGRQRDVTGNQTRALRLLPWQVLSDRGSFVCCEQPLCLATGQDLAGLLFRSSSTPGPAQETVDWRPPAAPALCPRSWWARCGHGRRHLCVKHADSFPSCSLWSKCWTGLKINW